jgi:hypothetical protein
MGDVFVTTNIWHPEHHEPRLIFHIGPVSEQQLGQAKPRALYGQKVGPVAATMTLTDSQESVMSIQFTDKRSNPTSAPPNAAPPVWMIDNTDLASLTPSADGSSCVVAASGPLGSGVVSVKVNDTNGNPLAAGSIGLTVQAGAPTNIQINPGTPTEQ